MADKRSRAKDADDSHSDDDGGEHTVSICWKLGTILTPLCAPSLISSYQQPQEVDGIIYRYSTR